MLHGRCRWSDTNEGAATPVGVEVCGRRELAASLRNARDPTFRVFVGPDQRLAARLVTLDHGGTDNGSGDASGHAER